VIFLGEYYSSHLVGAWKTENSKTVRRIQNGTLSKEKIEYIGAHIVNIHKQ